MASASRAVAARRSPRGLHNLIEVLTWTWTGRSPTGAPATSPAGAGLPPKKQIQHEEVLAPLDRAERREAMTRALARRDASRSSRATTPPAGSRSGRGGASARATPARTPGRGGDSGGGSRGGCAPAACSSFGEAASVRSRTVGAASARVPARAPNQRRPPAWASGTAKLGPEQERAIKAKMRAQKDRARKAAQRVAAQRAVVHAEEAIQRRFAREGWPRPPPRVATAGAGGGGTAGEAAPPAGASAVLPIATPRPSERGSSTRVGTYGGGHLDSESGTMAAWRAEQQQQEEEEREARDRALALDGAWGAERSSARASRGLPSPIPAAARPLEAWPEPMAQMAFVPPSPPPPTSVLIGRVGMPYTPGRLAGPSQPGARDWHDAVASARAAELGALLCEFGALEPRLALECLSRARELCARGEHRSLAAARTAAGCIAAMHAHQGSERVQAEAAELLGLMASGPVGLEQRLFDAGAVEACLEACERFPTSHGVLGAAFQAIGNVCYAAQSDDRSGCERKRAAVEMGALECICRGMLSSQDKWVQEAGVIAIGGLCNGHDDHGHARRARARQIGATSLAIVTMDAFPVGSATPTHAEAYAAAYASIRKIIAVDEYHGPPLC